MILRPRGNLHQLHHTTAPSTNRLDPQTRTEFVAGLQILKIGEVAMALEQTKAARVVIDKRTNLERLRVDQRTPEPFASAVPDRQAIRVVHRRTKIIDPHPIVGTKE